TAGSSIEVALNAVEQREDGAVDPMTGEFVNVITGAEKHMTARACEAFVGEEVWNSYFKFSVVRNPFDRLHSIWWNLQHVGTMHAVGMREFADVAFHRGVRGRLTNWRKGRWKIHQRYWPQAHWLRSQSGEIEMDQVLKFENIAADFAQLAGRIGLPSTELPKVLMKNRRPSSRRPYVEDYDSETRRIVTDYYREDLEAFGYEFE
ncbi:MAG: sulfotransferase family 2 domain-containing protein, partial [Woeseiaceae bacterium]|nr:sulfotransferase family protein [Gammaproteobacteria bacterium]NNK24827.1 sulfotransferase family 2 domain-containing protein [Woeseiaceae bacterium]